MAEVPAASQRPVNTQPSSPLILSHRIMVSPRSMHESCLLCDTFITSCILYSAQWTGHYFRLASRFKLMLSRGLLNTVHRALYTCALARALALKTAFALANPACHVLTAGFLPVFAASSLQYIYIYILSYAQNRDQNRNELFQSL